MIEGQRSVPDMMCKFIFLRKILWYGWDGSENCFGRPTMTLTLGNGQGHERIWIFFDTFCDTEWLSWHGKTIFSNIDQIDGLVQERHIYNFIANAL